MHLITSFHYNNAILSTFTLIHLWKYIKRTRHHWLIHWRKLEWSEPKKLLWSTYFCWENVCCCSFYLWHVFNFSFGKKSIIFQYACMWFYFYTSLEHQFMYESIWIFLEMKMEFKKKKNPKNSNIWYTLFPIPCGKFLK